jgi:TPR repeat protein
LYQKGIGVKKDKKMARKWYEKSYSQGEDKAYARLMDPDLN